MAGNRLGISVLLGAATLTALATAACTASVTPTGDSARSTTGNWQTVGSATSTATQAKQKLMFPDTSFSASIDGYDTAAQMVEFHVVKWVPGPDTEGGYQVDPSKPEQYRLPLAANVKILSVSVLCFTHQMPDMTGTPCTAQQLINGLSNGQQEGFADIHVDATDHIDNMKEDYVP